MQNRMGLLRNRSEAINGVDRQGSKEERCCGQTNKGMFSHAFNGQICANTVFLPQWDGRLGVVEPLPPIDVR